MLVVCCWRCPSRVGDSDAQERRVKQSNEVLEKETESRTTRVETEN